MLPAEKARSVAQVSDVQSHRVSRDGVFQDTKGEPVLQEASAPATAELQDLLEEITP